VVVLSLAFFCCHGVESTDHYYGVAEVFDGYDAVGKVQRGDRILAVDGTPVFFEQGPPLVIMVTEHHGDPVVLTVRRDGIDRQVTIKPKLKDDGRGLWVLGIRPMRQTDSITDLATTVPIALRFPFDETRAVARSVCELFAGSETADPGGPRRIIDEYERAVEPWWIFSIELTLQYAVYLMLIMISADLVRAALLGIKLGSKRS
jgi:hypothetical protein